MYGKEEEVKKNQVAPSERPQSHQIGSKTESMDILNYADDEEKVNVFEEEENTLKRLSIRGIEFDWIFHGNNADQFLKDLSVSDNINIFGQDIIRDIILFQWMYFKKVIIMKLFLPYGIYFIIFCVYTTWLIERQFNEADDDGVYHISSFAVGGIILLFNCFWAYVETKQILFHGVDYVYSFWNMLDLFSVIMNVTVVVMDFSGSSFNDINRVSSI